MKPMLTAEQLQEIVYRHYDQYSRSLPWRQPETDGSFSAYKILVSEIMLQQTQVSRVTPKYRAFVKQFPTASELARAPLAAVLAAWSGLGYNRRAKYLHEAAKQLADKSRWTMDDLVACKGIGRNTAAAVMCYAYDQPEPFIETNIRSVYIHHFFADSEAVSDREIMECLTATFDYEHPRQFGWALMDYGNWLKRTAGNAARRSQHYARQSAFEGSLRQLRGRVLKELIAGGKSEAQLAKLLEDERLPAVLAALTQEGLITQRDDQYYLP